MNDLNERSFYLTPVGASFAVVVIGSCALVTLGRWAGVIPDWVIGDPMGTWGEHRQNRLFWLVLVLLDVVVWAGGWMLYSRFARFWAGRRGLPRSPP